MKTIVQKRIFGFFNTKRKTHAKMIKYCNSQVMNETEDKEDEIFCLSDPKELVK